MQMKRIAMIGASVVLAAAIGVGVASARGGGGGAGAAGAGGAGAGASGGNNAVGGWFPGFGQGLWLPTAYGTHAYGMVEPLPEYLPRAKRTGHYETKRVWVRD